MIQTFSDASNQGYAVELKSTTSTAITYKKSPIIWITKNQTITGIYASGAEYSALSCTGQHTEGIKTVCIVARIMVDDPCAIKIDNQAVFVIL